MESARSRKEGIEGQNFFQYNTVRCRFRYFKGLRMEGAYKTMTMRKQVTTVLTVILCTVFLTLSPAWAATQEKAAPTPVNLGQDGSKMQWYIVNYGKDDAAHFAVARKYYTNASEKKKTVELLMSKFGLSQEAAQKLYFTEYGYTYSKDGKQFALTYLTHYDMVGTVVYSTEYPDTAREYVVMSKNMVPYKAYLYATGKRVAPPVQRNAAPKVVK